MKKLTFVLVFVFAFVASSFAQSYLYSSFNSSVLPKQIEKHRTLHTGFWLKTSLMLPSDMYGYAEDEDVDKNFAQKGFDFQIGTTFYITPVIGNVLRIGIDATWLEFSFAKLNPDLVDNGRSMHICFLGAGPIVSLSPTEMIAFDMYYKALPNYGWWNMQSDDTYETTSYNWNGFGLSHALGIGFRFSVLYVGFEYNWGMIDYTNLEEDSFDPDKTYINNKKITLGVRF